MKHIKLLGMAMSRLHGSAQTYGGEMPRVSDEYRLILERMEHYFADPHIARAMQQKLSTTQTGSFYKLGALLDETDALPNQQPLHLDFVRGNVLFRQAEEHDTLVVDGLALSGILDLEKAASGHPLYDLARTYAFLLVDCDKPPEKIHKYFLHSGYVKRGGGVANLFAGASNSRLFEQLVTLFLFYDFYKFLRQNPYESLSDNHHFVRTRDILIERKVLQLA